MLTPRFQLSQDETFLILEIYAPFTNVSETEIFMEDKDFRFFSKPYFLRLHLPGAVTESDDTSAKYVAESKSFLVHATKKTPGEVFKGLDLLTSLLNPKGETKIDKPNIEFVAQNGDAPGEEDEEEIEWYYDQQVQEKEEEDETGPGLVKSGYGFGFQETGVFRKLAEECQEILDVKNPDSLTAHERRTQRTALEDQKFCPDHYLCDLHEDDVILDLISFTSPWTRVLQHPGDDGLKAILPFTPEDRERMIALPRKAFLVDPKDLQSVYFGLVDLLFAHCYDYRINLGEPCAESDWNLSKLSATLSCCERHNTLQDVIRVCVRRSLIYPLHRHWDLAIRVFKDVADLLRVGRPAVVKALVSVIPLMIENEGRYIFNQLYLEPYAAWIQSVNPETLKSLAESITTCLPKLTKADMNLDLDELELAAMLALEEEQEKTEIDLTREIGKLDIKSKVAQEDSDDDTDSDSDDSDSDSGSSSGDDSSSEEETSEK